MYPGAGSNCARAELSAVGQARPSTGPAAGAQLYELDALIHMAQQHTSQPPAPSTAQMLADSAIEINSARLALLQTAWEADNDMDVSTRISMIKVQAAETLCRVADRAVQIYGGLGYCRDLPIERYYRDARIYRIYDGTSEIHRTIIARAISKGDQNFYNLNLT